MRASATAFFAATLVVSGAAAQDSGVSLGDLARQERQRKSAVSKPARVFETLDESTNCGANWACFMQAVADRLPVRLSVPDVVDLGEAYGWVIRSEVQLEVRGCTPASCVLRGRTQNSTLKFTDGTRQRYAATGATAEWIDEQEAAAQRRVARQDEAEITCAFQPERLKTFLERRRDGSTSDEDWKLAERCEGLDQTINNPFAPVSPRPRP